MSFDETLKTQRIPQQTIAAGQRVALRYDSGDYDGWNYLRAGLEGTVLGYATPDIQRRQIWPGRPSRTTSGWTATRKTALGASSMLIA